MDQVFERYKEHSVSAALEAVEYGAAYAKKLIVERLKGSGTKAKGGRYTMYESSQKYRREKEGLQTSHKDFHFSGTLFDNFEISERVVTPQRAQVTMTFEGQHRRRPDQKPASNKQVAQWLSDYEGGGYRESVVSLSDQEKKKVKDKMIEQFRDFIKNVTIDDQAGN